MFGQNKLTSISASNTKFEVDIRKETCLPMEVFNILNYVNEILTIKLRNVFLLEIE